jgi:thiamine transport system substrate-binding protein
MRATAIVIMVIFSMIGNACGIGSSTPTSQDGTTQNLKVLVHDSFAINATLVEEFEKAQNVKMEFIKAGDAGSVLNKALLTKDNPLADVIYGIDNTFLSRALKNDLLEVYIPAALADITAQYQMDKTNRAIPVDFGDVCINYDKAYFLDHNLAVPQSLEDLLKSDYKGLLVMENPTTSSPGLAFLLATIAKYGAENYLDYWLKLKANGLVVVNDWETAYYTNFSGSSGKGPQPMVVSYGTSPAAEVVYASTPIDISPTASLVGDDMCFRQVEFIGILKGTQKQDLAEKFIDFMLSIPVQEDIPLQMFVFPANSKAALPDVFVKNIQIPVNLATMGIDEINQNREKWLADWTTAILR